MHNSTPTPKAPSPGNGTSLGLSQTQNMLLGSVAGDLDLLMGLSHCTAPIIMQTAGLSQAGNHTPRALLERALKLQPAWQVPLPTPCSGSRRQEQHRSPAQHSGVVMAPPTGSKLQRQGLCRAGQIWCHSSGPGASPPGGFQALLANKVLHGAIASLESSTCRPQHTSTSRVSLAVALHLAACS